MRSRLLFILGTALAGCARGGSAGGKTESERSDLDGMVVPRYTSAGELVRPEGYTSWYFAGSSIGLGYSEGRAREGPGAFHAVYLQPEAYRHYARTGRFPEKTIFMLELREPSQRDAPVKQGWYAGKQIALEAAVKDRAQFPEGWAYFDFADAGKKDKATAFPPAACHACHLEHGADDNVFVQFYPPLRALMESRSAEGKAAGGKSE